MSSRYLILNYWVWLKMGSWNRFMKDLFISSWACFWTDLTLNGDNGSILLNGITLFRFNHRYLLASVWALLLPLIRLLLLLFCSFSREKYIFKAICSQIKQRKSLMSCLCYFKEWSMAILQESIILWLSMEDWFCLTGSRSQNLRVSVTLLINLKTFLMWLLLIPKLRKTQKFLWIWWKRGVFKASRVNHTELRSTEYQKDRINL